MVGIVAAAVATVPAPPETEMVLTPVKPVVVSVLPEGTAWLDSGTFSSLHDASSYVRIVEERQGIKVGCPEEIAWRNGWINDQQLAKSADELAKSGYGTYLRGLLNNG